MDQALARFLLSDEARLIDAETLRVYLVLRADVLTSFSVYARTYKVKGELASGLDLHTCATFTGLPELTVRRRLEELRKRGWLRSHCDGFLLGSVSKTGVYKWFSDFVPDLPVEVPAGEQAVFEKLASDAQARLSKKAAVSVRRERKAEEVLDPSVAAEVVGTLHPPANVQKMILLHFAGRYEAIYHTLPEMFWSRERPKPEAYVYIKRGLGHAGGPDELLRLIDFTFDRWEEIVAHAGWQGKPEVSLFGAKGFAFRLLEWLRLGEVVGKLDPAVADSGRDDAYAGAKDGW